MKSLIVFLLIFLTLLGCDNKELQTKRINQYFDIIPYLEISRKEFVKHQPTVFKKTIIKGVSDSLNLDSLNWKKELSPFEIMDLNKVAFKDGFISDGKVVDNLVLNIYYKKEETKSDIKYLKVVLTKSNKLLFVQCKTEKNNLIFNSVKEYKIDFDTITNLVTSYSLSGNQGFLFLKEDKFTIQGNIIR